MAANKPEDDHPSFDDLLKDQLDPLLKKAAVEQKLLRDFEAVASEATKSQQIKAFDNRKFQIGNLLDKLDVKDKLDYVRKNVWRRGVVEPIIEDTTLDLDRPELTRGKVLVGYRMSYRSPAVIEFEGEHGLIAKGYSYDTRRYFPVSETQNLEFVASQQPEGIVLVVDSSTILDVPKRIVNHFSDVWNVVGDQCQRFPLIYYDIDPSVHKQQPTSYDWVNGRLIPTRWSKIEIDLSFGRMKSETDLYKAQIYPTDPRRRITLPMRRLLEAFVERLEHPGTPIPDISTLEETERQVKHQEFQSEEVNVFDRFLLEDCRERIQKDRLPLQAREHWFKFIQGPDSFDVFFGFNRVYIGEIGSPGRSLSPAFSDQPSSRFFYVDTVSPWAKGSRDVYANYAEVKDLVEKEMTPSEINTFKSTFEHDNGFSFDDVVEWMRGAPRITHRGDGIFMDEEELVATNSLIDHFNKVNSVSVYDQETGLARDQAAIKLFLLAYHYKLRRIRDYREEDWGRFRLEEGNKVWG